jgi:GNAT superfamily N-acetyltransferase
MIRDAAPDDAPAIAALIAALGYDVSEAEVRARLADAGALVADQEGVIGVLTTNVMTVLHRPRPVGRISMLVVAEAARGRGIGAALVAAAERQLRDRGCGLIEVTSNARRERAHAFYERLGYERTSFRFARTLQD